MRHALRRLLWTLPALVGISIISFFFLSFVPEPTDDPAVAEVTTTAELLEIRRARFLDLPRFLNTNPRDVQARANEAVDAIARGGEGAQEARKELVRLGGAALPYVVPRLATLPQEPRTEVALALAPIARRMGLIGVRDAEDPALAVAFWTRFWDDRGVEFRSAQIHSAVGRLVRYGTASRASELVELDTFVLDEVFAALETPVDQAGIDRARSLVDIAVHVTGHDDRIARSDGLAAAQATVERWKRFWSIYRSDYVTFRGPSRIAAMVLETRYGKWALQAVTHRFGHATGGALVLDDLQARAPLTLVILFGGIALAYAIAIPLGSLSAAYRGKRIDLAIGGSVIALYSIPSAFFAMLFAAAYGLSLGKVALPIFVLSLSLVAAPTRQQRSALASALSQDYVRAAVARGAGRLRALLVHALKNSLLPVVTLATLEAPMALSRVFVIEHVFSLRGLGEATILAVQQKDVAWLMAFSIFAAAVSAIFVFLTDLTYTLVDPRLAAAIRRGRG